LNKLPILIGVIILFVGMLFVSRKIKFFSKSKSEINV